MKKKANKRFQYFINLILCRSTFHKNKDGNDNVKRDLVDDAEDTRNNQKFSQKLQQNFSKFMRNKVMTKDKFERELRAAAKDVTR